MELKVRKPFFLNFEKVPTPLKVFCDNIYVSLRFSESLNTLISLVRTNVDETLLNTMIQFYDPLLHCFTFRDFQLVPSLEEFSYLLGLPILDRIPYTGKEEDPKWEDIAAALHLPKAEIEKGVLSLLIYGQVLFHHYDKIVDVDAIKIFLSKNPVPTLLGDLLHSIHFRASKRKGCVLGCAPLLHKWFILHLHRSVRRNEEGLTWAQRIMKLSFDDVICAEYFSYDSDEANKRDIFIKAWSKVKKVGAKDIGRRNYIPLDPYFQWIYDRVVEFGMSYPSDTPIVPRITPPAVPVAFEPYVPSPNEDLVATVNQLKREMDDFERRLREAEAEKEVLIANAKEWETLLDYFSRK
ncbi:uncharacterized protein LOC131661943 [Vicia villosa]|uniref:uncharacterized protein LOC131661943 n=1 Tax=Vicia villosa TaxID=3911 RepID=UPI00273C11CA|nr:uncharacterized protein LOC131661943 [Vicia villosa]